MNWCRISQPSTVGRTREWELWTNKHFNGGHESVAGVFAWLAWHVMDKLGWNQWWLTAEAEALMVGSCTDKNRYYTHQSIAARLTHYFPSHRFEWFQPRSGSKGPSTITASDMYTRLDMWPSWKVGTNMGKFTPSAGDDWGFILSDSA